MRKNWLLSILFLLTINQTTTFAQQDSIAFNIDSVKIEDHISIHIEDRGSLWRNFTYDFGNFFAGAGYAYTRPLHWGGKEFKTFGLVAAGTAGLYIVDEDTSDFFRERNDDLPQILRDYGFYAGQPQNNYMFTGSVYLAGLFTKNNKLRRTGVLLISSATATGFLQQVLKSATGRARPTAGFGYNHFRPFGGSAAYRSFPSGHAVLTFTNAHVIAKQVRSPWIKAGIYTVGLWPGLSRVFNGSHYLSDVFLSWAMSYFVVESIDLYLDRKYDNKYNADSNKRYKTSFNLTFGGNTVGLTYQF